MITPEYFSEKVEAFNVAISALELHEGASDVPKLSRRLRMKLADTLALKRDRWMEKHRHQPTDGNPI